MPSEEIEFPHASDDLQALQTRDIKNCYGGWDSYEVIVSNFPLGENTVDIYKNKITREIKMFSVH